MTRHPLDVLSLIFGLLFAAVGAAALFDVLDFDLFTVDWLWPAALIGSGVAVLLTLGSRQPAGEPAIDDPGGQPGDDRATTDR